MAKREKTVFESRMIAHNWAHNLTAGKANRNPQGNHHFQGSLIYSYREPLARKLRNAKDASNPVFLIREFSYSLTTSRHQRWVNNAVYGVNVFRHVADIGEVKWNSGDVVTIPHKKNLAHYGKLITEAGIKFTRCRAATKEWRLREVQGLVNLANRYAEYFKLATRFEVPNADQIAATIAKAKADNAKRTRQQIETARKQAEHTARMEAERNAKIIEGLPKWLAGESLQGTGVDLFFVRQATGRQTDYMRIEGTEVVTQRGARVPLHHVKRALPLILRTLRTGGEWTRGTTDVELRVSDFRVDHVGNGGVTIGCHRFDTAEIERLASIIASAPDSIV